MKIYILTTCKENRIELLEIYPYTKYKDAYKHMKTEYLKEIGDIDNVVESCIGSHGASIVFEYEDNINLPYVWCISEHNI